MTRYYIAKFSNGVTKKRSSVSRDYTHAYQFAWETSFGGEGVKIGFSTSRDQAERNLLSESAWIRKRQGIGFSEVVAIEEISAKEYRA